MGWTACDFEGEQPHELDGNDMVSAINKMEEKKHPSSLTDYDRFESYSFKKWDSGKREQSFTPWLCANFFNLMSEALEKKIIGKE
jgi:hypothetical protein